MAKVLATGSSKNNKDSKGRRRGFKIFVGSAVRAGNIVLRQLGSVWYPGDNCVMGRDFTINATRDGTLFGHSRGGRRYLSVRET